NITAFDNELYHIISENDTYRPISFHTHTIHRHLHSFPTRRSSDLVARLMIHTPTAISIFVCLSMVQLMAVFISMRCTLCGHFLQVALTLILVVGYAIAAS